MSIRFNCPHCGFTTEAEESQSGFTVPCGACGQEVLVPGVRNFFPAAQASDRFQFSLRKLLGVVTVVCVLLMLVALLLPAQRGAREAARRNQCINNLKNLGLALHNHHDIHNRLPLASSEPRSGRPGIGTGPNPAGYSWIAGLLPFIEEVNLWDEIAKGTNNLQVTPFDPAGKPELSCINIQILRCPSFGGPLAVNIRNSEYQEYNPLPGYNMPGGKQSPAISNYVALVSSHFGNSSGPGELFNGRSQDTVAGNGLLTFPLATSDVNHGLGLKAATDGTSKTVVLTESKEEAYCAWMDGQATWVIGAWQGDSNVPNAKSTADGFLGWAESDTTSCTSVGIGSPAFVNSGTLPPGDRIYLTAERYGSGHDRVWGPSSEHTGGAVNHLFADGHVISLVGSTIDKNIYLRIITREGAEPIILE